MLPRAKIEDSCLWALFVIVTSGFMAVTCRAGGLDWLAGAFALVAVSCAFLLVLATIYLVMGD